MIVKVGTDTFNSLDIPIMITLSQKEKELIANMGSQTKLCSFPENYDRGEIAKFMQGDTDHEHNKLLN